MLLLSPFAWGCERTDMRDCTMADCSMMADMQDDEGCHEPTESQGHESAGCSQGPEFGTSCCDAPIGQQPALIDFVAAGDGGVTPLILLSEPLQAKPPARPPDRFSEAISSQEHQLGRYTLLASFLL